VGRSWSRRDPEAGGHQLGAERVKMAFDAGPALNCAAQDPHMAPRETVAADRPLWIRSRSPEQPISARRPRHRPLPAAAAPSKSLVLQAFGTACMNLIRQ